MKGWPGRHYDSCDSSQSVTQNDNLGNPDKGELPLMINTFRTFRFLLYSLQDTTSTSFVDPTLVERWF